MQEVQNENEFYRNKATRLHQSQGNVVSIATRLGLGSRGTVVRFLAEVRDSSSL